MFDADGNFTRQSLAPEVISDEAANHYVARYP